ncbi:lysine transporter LysM [Vibrio sp.]|uniref:Lysine transporter LysM n=1 Tax=Vibrio viridaestus TaxID=2487322 RepID=A0A3N9TBR1_9VIBR|nr:LysM-like peptidoglycan-binding domain-containing protein [Vibrio viridaestus]MDC0611266.1 lysine transporter LysM [Vibrio sp.]RQW61591.1 lysine transporter LysM [Vibrio viridaestus]
MNHRRNKQNNIDNYMTLFQQKWSEIDFRSMCSGALEQTQTLWSDFPVMHKRVLMGLVPFVIIISFIPLPSSSNTEQTPADSSSKRIPLTLSSDTSQSNNVTATENQAIRSSAWVTYTIQDGDTLSKIFRSNDLPISDLNSLIQVEGPDKPLSNVRPGQLIRFKLAKTGQLDILQLEKSDQSVMFFRLSDGGFGRSN